LPNGNIKKEYVEAKNNKNEVQVVFSGLFLFYKTFFSSQDLTVCTFTPSCSEYGILAVKKFGMVKGGVMTMDRLTRCNGLSPQNYEFDKTNMLLKDDPRITPAVSVVSNIK
jgi:putative membrane protein insertion efficiency factor